jgi:hypothetical protein
MLSFNGEKPDLLVHDVRPAGDREQEILLVHLGPLFRVDPLAAMFLGVGAVGHRRVMTHGRRSSARPLMVCNGL